MNLSWLFPLIFAVPYFTVAQAQQVTLPLWTHGAPEPSTVKGAERDTTAPTDKLIAGRRIIKLADVAEPTLAVYRAEAPGSPAVLVFPGGGYSILAYDLEGTEVCTWLNSIHVTCVLVKYRVPYQGHYPERNEDLEDAQQAMRLTRAHATEWGVDAKRIGVLGFSAGGHLAVALSNHSDFAPTTGSVKDHGGVDPAVSARPDFALIVYPGYLVHWPDVTQVAPEAVPTASTPPTFLVQAEDDPVHEENALVYFQAFEDCEDPLRTSSLRRRRPWLRPAAHRPAHHALARARRDVAPHHQSSARPVGA